MEELTTEHSVRKPIYHGTQKEVFDISLLLSSQTLPHWIEVQPESQYEIVTEDIYREQSRTIIALYIKENKDFFILPATTYPLAYKPQTLLLLLIPTVLFLFETVGHQLEFLHKIGNAHSQLIFKGEWWRTFTALTLHSGPGHYMSNMISGFLIFNLIAVRTNIGFWLFGILISSACANFFVALTWSDVVHRSVGFSTAVFGGLGLLAMIEMRASIQIKKMEIRNFAPLLAALFLVVFMGIGERSDVLAHFYGFFFGALYGVIVPLKKDTEVWGQIFLVSLGYITIFMSWVFATNYFVF